MATTVTHVVDPDGGAGHDYDSLSLWEAGEQGDLTGVRDEIAVAKCRCTGGTADTTQVIIDGWSTSTTQYIKIWTDPSESYRHAGVWPTGNKYRLVVGCYLGLINTAENNVKLYGLALHATPHNWDEGAGFYAGDAGLTGMVVESCIIKSTATSGNGYGTGAGIYIRNLESGVTIIRNNIVYGPFGKSIYISFATGSAAGAVFNNTCHGSAGTGGAGLHIGINGGTCYFTNNISQDSLNQDDIYSTGTSSPLTNISSDASSPNTALRNIALSFTNLTVGSEDFHLDSTDTEAIGAGTNLYNDANYPFQTDIDGDDRGGAAAAWDIGADEYVAAGGGSIVPLLLYQYRARRQ